MNDSDRPDLPPSFYKFATPLRPASVSLNRRRRGVLFGNVVRANVENIRAERGCMCDRSECFSRRGSARHEAGATRRVFRPDEAAFIRAREVASISCTSLRVASRNGPASAAWYKFTARPRSPAFS